MIVSRTNPPWFVLFPPLGLAEAVQTDDTVTPYRHKYELPVRVPLPPGGWTDEGKFLEYIDGAWQRKPGLGRWDVSATASSALTLLEPLLDARGPRAIFGVHVIAVPDLLRPNVSVTFPRYTLYQDYLIAPVFLAIEIMAGKSQFIPLTRKCIDRYHSFGTPFCWILDVEARVGFECHRGADTATAVDAMTAGAGIRVQAGELFAELD
jgi:hypothetical protein